MTDPLEAALRVAGHDKVADYVRDRELAQQLADAGHPDLAHQLDPTNHPEPDDG
jgi:hypothetical protein